jgi:hypothetical protein
VGYDGSSPVTVVIFTGSFTDHQARGPMGAADPTGTTISYVVDQSGTTTDYGLTGAVSNLPDMGSPETVSVSPQGS